MLECLVVNIVNGIVAGKSRQSYQTSIAMVKIFVGNLAHSVDATKLRALFEQYGVAVKECDVLKTYAFVVGCLAVMCGRLCFGCSMWPRRNKRIWLSKSSIIMSWMDVRYT